MKHFEKIVILCGGQSGERDVSLHSSEPVFEALKKMYPTQLLRLDVNVLPTELNPETDLIFPLIHGDFGEDGQLQALLEERNFTYVGSDAKASALCMDKIRSKHLAAENGISVLPAIELTIGQALDREMLEKTLKTTAFVLKPTDKGSSIGVHLCEDFDALCKAWSEVKEGHWMIEPYVRGRELTVGLLHGKAIGVGEICPKEGFYDYHNKYTEGACDYFFPAHLEEAIAERLRHSSEIFFKAAGCRDFGRADFIMDTDGNVWFLEMNTIPGMTTQSLLPKSAVCIGISFEALLRRLVDGVCERSGKCFRKN